MLMVETCTTETISRHDSHLWYWLSVLVGHRLGHECSQDTIFTKSIISDAVKRTSHHKEATHEDVDRAIKEWLRRAKERCVRKVPASVE